MTLKNYTSETPSARSVQFIEDKLTAAGARDIMKRYDPVGRLDSICFTMQVNGTLIPFKLPAKVDNVETVLRARFRKPLTDAQAKNVRSQAERTAWKLMAEWVHVNLSLLEINQAETLEILLPFVYDAAKHETFFERLKTNKFRGLLPSAGGQGT